METQTIHFDAVPAVAEDAVTSMHSCKAGDEQTIISGWRMRWLEFRIRMTIARVVFRHVKSPVKWISILQTLDQHRRSYLGEHRIKKLVRVDGRYHWDLYVPGWGSKVFNEFIAGEVNRITPVHRKSNRFVNVFMAITKKCPLQCEHCFEWEALNNKEKLTSNDLHNMVATIQEKGTGQIQLTGGEPMLRINDIVDVVTTFRKGSEFWILTSGFGLTLEKARRLKDAGLTGVVISLDHFVPELHNQFRGFENAYAWVEKAVASAKEVHLVTAISLCATRSFVSEVNLMAYADLAMHLGVAFVQIIEPKAVGHYEGQDVLLHPEHIQELESFYLKMNLDPAFAKYPIINYHGYHQRRSGCLASGNRMLYIDTDGDLHACPFCRKKYGSLLHGQFDAALTHLQRQGCHSFKTSSI